MWYFWHFISKIYVLSPLHKKFIRRKVITNYSTTVNITPSVNFQSLDVFGFSQFFWVVSSLLINLSRFSSLCVGERTRLMVQNQNKGKSDGKIGLRFQVYFIFFISSRTIKVKQMKIRFCGLKKTANHLILFVNKANTWQKKTLEPIDCIFYSKLSYLCFPYLCKFKFAKKGMKNFAIKIISFRKFIFMIEYIT